MYSMNRHVVASKKRVILILNYYARKNDRSMSTNNKNIIEDKIKKSVFISQSSDIFTNLALENWLYCNSNFMKNQILLIWKNDPCVVIGRNQNPWLEINCQDLEENGISLARRDTGGKTIYHDSENLNMSFFTGNNSYNGDNNLEIISRALQRKFGIESNINDSYNIDVTDNLKIFSSATKVGQTNAYHNCTLVMNCKRNNPGLALERKETGISTEATKSVKMPLNHMYEVYPNVSVNKDALISAIGWEYLRTNPATLKDGGSDLTQQQRGFQMINPTEAWFPGLDALRQKYKSWYWNYGKTPKFTITRLLKFQTDSKNSNMNFHLLNLTIEVENGIVVDIKLSLPPNFMQNDKNQDASVITNLRGSKYGHEFTDNIITALGCTSIPLDIMQTADKSNIAATQ